MATFRDNCSFDILVLLDQSSLVKGDTGAALAQVQANLHPDAEIAIIGFDTSARLLQGFRSDTGVNVNFSAIESTRLTPSQAQIEADPEIFNKSIFPSAVDYKRATSAAYQFLQARRAAWNTGAEPIRRARLNAKYGTNRQYLEYRDPIIITISGDTYDDISDLSHDGLATSLNATPTVSVDYRVLVGSQLTGNKANPYVGRHTGFSYEKVCPNSTAETEGGSSTSRLVPVQFTAIVLPEDANTDELVPSDILLDGKSLGFGKAKVQLTPGATYTVTFKVPEHPDFYFTEGIPAVQTFTIPVNSTGESYECVFNGIRLPNSFISVTATYDPPITNKKYLGEIYVDGIKPVTLNRVTDKFNFETDSVILQTGDSRLKLRVPPGVYSVSFKDIEVPGMTYVTPSPFRINVREGQTVSRTVVYRGIYMPSVYWLKPLASSEMARVNLTTTKGMFSDNIGNLTAFFTGSVNASIDNHYTHIYHVNPATVTASIQFSVAYGHVQGSGSNDEGGQYNDTPTRAIYGQYRNIILGNSQERFNLTGTETDHFYLLSYQKDRRDTRADYDALEINLAHLSGSEFINGEGYMSAHTGSNVTIGGAGKVLRLITDSKINTNPSVGFAGVEYNIVSGSIEDGIFNLSAPNYYGKLYPSLGVVLLDASKLDISASFGTVTAREVDAKNQNKLFTAISGAAQYSDTSGDKLGMKARATKDEIVNYYFINVRNREFNFTNNPTFRDIASGEIRDITAYDRPKAYITTIGLYDQQRNLIAVGKVSKPELKSFTEEVTFNVKLKY